MKKLLALFILCSISLATFAQKGEWVELFNGKNLDGWKLPLTALPLSQWKMG